MSNPLKFDGRVVLIAGDTGEIGKHIAQAFLSAGADVVNCGRERPEHLPEAAGRKASFTALNNGDADQIAAVFDSVAAHYGHIDVLVSIAGDPPADARHRVDSAESDIRRGLITPLHFNQAANRLMQLQTEGGTIINISRAGEPLSTQLPGGSAAATAGLANLGSSLAVEWAPRVRVNTVTVVLTQTEHPGSNGKGGSSDIEFSSKLIPGATGQLPGVGNTCLFLASPLASYISGTHLTAAQM